MSYARQLVIGLSITLLGCDPARPPVGAGPSQPALAKPTAVLPADTSLQDIYDFMREAIADQHLTRTHAIAFEPRQCLSASESDTLFLPTLRTDRQLYKKRLDSLMYNNVGLIPRCLTRADVAAMLRQKQRFISFQWHKARLGFGPAKGERYYRFSGPLFSEDKTKALLAIEDLCPGLCGTGRAVLFVKEEGRWKSKGRSFAWYY